MKINHLTAAEEHLMRLFWKLNSFYLKDIMEQHPEPKPHQNTVSTYLKILVEKDYLTTKKEGRIFKYTVLVPFEEYKKFLLLEFLRNFFNNSGKEFLEFLLNGKLILQEDLKDYIHLNTEVKVVKAKESTLQYPPDILISKKDKKGKDKKKKKKKDQSK